MTFKDHFSGHAALYRGARPGYPDEFVAWIVAQAPTRDLAWDCGCGNGQVTTALARHFDHVVGTDPSAAQIANAVSAPRVEYRVERAEASSLVDHTVGLVSVAQALHWFDLDEFYREVRRVLVPGGALVASTYGETEISPEVDGVVARLHREVLGPYWTPEHELVMSGYRTVAWPFLELAVPTFDVRVEWNLSQLVAYLRSWSAWQRFLLQRGNEPLALVEDELRVAWGAPTAVRSVVFPLAVRAGRC